MRKFYRALIDTSPAALLLMMIGVCYAYAQQKHVHTDKSEERHLHKFLQEYCGDNLESRYLSAWINLDDKGEQEVIIYLFDDDWCGSGGCATLILRKEGTSYKVITKITATRPPIRVLKAKSHGWHNLTVVVYDGWTIEAYEAELQFDGKTYPTNPTLAPAGPLENNALREIVIPYDFENAKSLYP